MARIKICLTAFIVFSTSLGCAMPIIAAKLPIANKGASQSKKQSNIRSHNSSEADIIPHLNNWEPMSFRADTLIDQGKFKEAEALLIRILPQAKKDAPLSFEYALTLCRLSTAYYALKQYSHALNQVQGAIAVLNRNPPSLRQRKIIYRCLLTKTAILLGMKKDAEAEALARKTVAYAIAFPDLITSRQTKIAYRLLRSSLEAQKKNEEAKKISKIMN